MPNELLLILSLFFLFGSVLVFYRLFGKLGLYVWTVIATIAANIEVLILVDAFGLEQTLGNVLFATTFLVTDILSENHSKKECCCQYRHWHLCHFYPDLSELDVIYAFRQ